MGRRNHRPCENPRLANLGPRGCRLELPPCGIQNRSAADVMRVRGFLSLGSAIAWLTHASLLRGTDDEDLSSHLLPTITMELFHSIRNPRSFGVCRRDCGISVANFRLH